MCQSPVLIPLLPGGYTYACVIVELYIHSTMKVHWQLITKTILHTLGKIEVRHAA